jgi:HEAT repeat protein
MARAGGTAVVCRSAARRPTRASWRRGWDAAARAAGLVLVLMLLAGSGAATLPSSAPTRAPQSAGPPKNRSLVAESTAGGLALLGTVLRSPQAAILRPASTAPGTVRAAAAGLGERGRESPQKALRRLESWAGAGPAVLGQVDVPRAEQAVTDALRAGFEAGERLDLALLELCGRELALPAAGTPSRSPQRLDAWRGGLTARLSGQWGAGTLELISDRVLLMPQSFSEPQRLAALDLLLLQPRERAAQALSFLASDPRASPNERLAGIEALVVCPGPAALEGLLRALESGPETGRAAARGGLVRRLDDEPSGGAPGADPELAERLARASLWALLDPDWRVAGAAAELCRHLPPAQAVPALIEALRHWHGRWHGPEAANQVGAGRVSWALTHALRRLTGRSIGPDPAGWQRLLEALAQGAPLVSEGGASSVPSFFGLSLESGHVAFLVDCSGSMSAPAPTTARPTHATDAGLDRLGAAAAELLRALEHGGSSLWFQIALFSDEGRLWRASPTRADERGIDAARRFLLAQSPGGGTSLSSGIAAWLGSRSPDGAGPPADTLVVLCDGETIEDRAWAENCLRDPRLFGVRVHAVQIGGAQAEALALLCQRTGGRLVRL